MPEIYRSVLFCPGNHERRLRKVDSFGADAIVLDLEDAVAVSEKATARSLVHDALPTYSRSSLVAVRVNGPDTAYFQDDLDAVVSDALDLVLVPKMESRETLREVDAMLGQRERSHGIDVGRIRLIPLIETSKGLSRVEEIAHDPPSRLVSLIFGSADFSTDAGIESTEDGMELLYARSRVVVAARAAGLEAPIDGPYLELQDVEGLIEDSQRSRRIGFQGRVVVYPPQVEHVHSAYSQLSADEEAFARKVVKAFEEAEARGVAAIQVDGSFVDYPMYRRAVEKLSRLDVSWA